MAYELLYAIYTDTSSIAGTVAERTPFLHKYLSNYNRMIARGGKDAAHKS